MILNFFCRISEYHSVCCALCSYLTSDAIVQTPCFLLGSVSLV